jgi:hypothetical protein
MSIATLILGSSGTGKSTSMRNLDPAHTLLIQCINKPLPFRSNGWKPCTKDNPQGSVIHTSNTETIMRAMRGSKKDVIVIDDYQATMVNEMMARSTEKGYEKFTDIAKSAWQLFELAGQLEEHRRVYILAHTQSDDHGYIRMKTVGRMVDEKIVPEGYFTIVLRTEIINGQYLFATQSNGQDCCKSPMGMFEEQHIQNDLAAVDSVIFNFYQLAQPA